MSGPSPRSAACGLAALAGWVLILQACSGLIPTAPPAELANDWRRLVAELRAFERSIGFRDTPNFSRLGGAPDADTYCGQGSAFALPYSYEDRSIRWLYSVSETQCQMVPADIDWHFGSVEVWGEVGTPVTPPMLEGELDRFVYVVLHEDCHDQFELPQGIEEALCNVLAYRAMAQFASAQLPWHSLDNRTVRSYARAQSRKTRATVAHYREAEALYARYARGEISREALRAARAALFGKLERALELPPGEINNVSLASHITYSRHYDYLESVVERFGELREAVEFFREVDARKPDRAAHLRRLANAERSGAPLEAYEKAIVESIRAALALRGAFPR